MPIIGSRRVGARNEGTQGPRLLALSALQLLLLGTHSAVAKGGRREVRAMRWSTNGNGLDDGRRTGRMPGLFSNKTVDARLPCSMLSRIRDVRPPGDGIRWIVGAAKSLLPRCIHPNTTRTLSCLRDKGGTLISYGEGTAGVQPHTLPHSRLCQTEHHPCLLHHAPGFRAHANSRSATRS